MESFLNFVGRIFGFRKNDKYISKYINTANIRSGIFMGAVVVILEIWLIIRQTNKYIIPLWGSTGNNFDLILSYISLFVLFLLSGLTVTFFCITYTSKTLSKNASFILNIVASGLLMLYTIYGFFEKYSAWGSSTRANLLNVLLILLYIFAFLIAASVMTHAFLSFFKKGFKSIVLATTVVIFFAVLCLTFGIRVSYSDHLTATTSISRITNHKEIICFLTMAIFVASLLIWKPWISILVNASTFIAFYLLISFTDAEALAADTSTIILTTSQGVNDPISTFALFVFKDGDFVNYITFLIIITTVSIMVYNQRLETAENQEQLEYIATYDDLTGLFNYHHFLQEVSKMMKDEDINIEDKIYLFINIESFKIYNDQKGFTAGNEYLKKVGELIQKNFKTGICCRQGDDHFVAFIDRDELNYLNELNESIRNIDENIALEIKVGGYVSINRNEDARRAADKARYACSVINGKHDKLYCEYDKEMHDEYHLMQYVIHNIDEAVAQGWIKPYYQPVVWSKTGELCGVEALARWIDPNKGFLSPASFVPTLESTRLIHKLDACIFESVCRDIRYNLDNNLPVVPVSVNFSRLDFELMDAVGLLIELVDRYQVPKELLHVEITESALMDDLGVLTKAINRLKENGFALWLDDFGSGYSSLNVLKDYDFDVLKIDMKFLSGFSNNGKAKLLIEAIIDMADRIGLKTLTEGVETEEEKNFLTEANCGRLQGYLYGKPMPKEELQNRINNGEFKISNQLA